jgi:hypothetical protein
VRSAGPLRVGSGAAACCLPAPVLCKLTTTWAAVHAAGRLLTSWWLAFEGSVQVRAVSAAFGACIAAAVHNAGHHTYRLRISRQFTLSVNRSRLLMYELHLACLTMCFQAMTGFALPM